MEFACWLFFDSGAEFLFLRQKTQEVRLWILLLRSLEWELWLRSMEVLLSLFQEMLSSLQITKIRGCTSSPSVLWVSIATINFHVVILLPWNDMFVGGPLIWCVVPPMLVASCFVFSIKKDKCFKSGKFYIEMCKNVFPVIFLS